MPSQICAGSRIASQTRVGNFSGNWGSFFPGAFCVFQADVGYDSIAHTWRDQSGNNLIAAPTNTGTNPIVTAGLNGHQGLSMPTVTTGMKWPMILPAPGSAPYYIFTVFRSVSWTVNRTIFAGNTSSSAAMFQVGSSPAIDMAVTIHANQNNSLPVGTFGAVECGFTASINDYTRAGSGNIVTGQSSGSASAETSYSVGANGSGVGANIEVLLFAVARGKRPPPNARAVAAQYWGPTLAV